MAIVPYLRSSIPETTEYRHAFHLKVDVNHQYQIRPLSRFDYGKMTDCKLSFIVI